MKRHHITNASTYPSLCTLLLTRTRSNSLLSSSIKLLTPAPDVYDSHTSSQHIRDCVFAPLVCLDRRVTYTEVAKPQPSPGRNKTFVSPSLTRLRCKHQSFDILGVIVSTTFPSLILVALYGTGHRQTSCYALTHRFNLSPPSPFDHYIAGEATRHLPLSPRI